MHSMDAPRSRWRAPIASRIPSLLWAVIFGTVFAGLPLLGSVFAATEPDRPTKSDGAQNAADARVNHYVGSAACTKCHREISQTFLATRMGRSLTQVTPALIPTLPVPGEYYSEKLGRHFEIFARDKKLFESEYQLGADGQEIFRNTYQVEWIIGAGANGYGALVRRGTSLFEAPLSFYEKTKTWELSPGFEARDLGFNRPILAGCIACHSGRAYPADQTTGKFAPIPFSQLSIGCENCHGPGRRHIRAVTTPTSGLQGSQIVNPDDLSAERENEICMSCHEAGDSRVPRPGKSYLDYRPGTPLDDTLSIFMVPPRRTDPEDKDHLQHYYEMSLSKCYRASNGQLRCATCHDPHMEPATGEASAFFNTRCMTCHNNNSCPVPLAARKLTTPANNCIGCHMPSRPADTPHTSLTNHRILAKPGEAWPEAAFDQTTAALPDLNHINRVVGRPDDVPELSLLEAYREIAERRPEYQNSYLNTLSQLQQSEPNDPVVLSASGKQAFLDGDSRGAITLLQRLIQLDPTQPMAYSWLSQALAREDRLPEAIDASEKAISLNQFDPLLHKALIDQLVAAKEYTKALAALQLYMELFPEDAQMRSMLALVSQ
jgi:hypothetical protein